MMKWTLQIENKSFNNLNLFLDTKVEFESGKFYAIKGESGIGKTTLLKMIGLLESFKGDSFINENKIINCYSSI